MNLPRPTTRLSAAVATTFLVAAGLVTTATTTSQANPQAAGIARPHHHCRVLRFGVEFSPQNVIDVPPLQATPGDYRPGDYVTFGDVLVNHAGRHVGTEAGTGMITRVDKAGAQIFYSMAIKLRGGQITASGIGSPDPHKYLAVTGGTGSFTGAAGAVSVTENGDAANTGTLVIKLR
jgi:hypothetical protein